MAKINLLSQSKSRKAVKIFLLLLPMLAFALIFVYYPFVKNILYSFGKVTSKGVFKGWSGKNKDSLTFWEKVKKSWAGLENYRYTYTRKDFPKALKHTLIIAGINVPLTLIITISLALLANKRRKLSPVYETLFTLPMSVSMSAACMIFKSMFSPSVGFINYFFGLKLGWYESTETALAACIILTVWMGIGFDFLLMLSALRGIPESVMEATRIDGISTFRRIFKVQIPLISPTIFYVLCTNLVLAMMTSAPMIIIMGVSAESTATTTLISMMYQSGFSSSDYGLAAVLSLTAFVMTLGFTIASFTFERKKVHYQ